MPPMLRSENFCLGGTEGADSTPEKSNKYHAKGVNRQMTTEEKVRKSLIDQLEAQNKVTDYCVDMVDTYMMHWRLKERLNRDIEVQGIRITVSTGNGHDKTIANPSVTDLQRETSIMLAILDKLDIKTPVIAGSADDYL